MSGNKIKVDGDLILFLQDFSPEVYDPNTGQLLGTWDFTDPVEIEVGGTLRDGSGRVTATFAEEGKEPVTVAIYPDDLNRVEQVVEANAPDPSSDPYVDVTVEKLTKGYLNITVGDQVMEQVHPLVAQGVLEQIGLDHGHIQRIMGMEQFSTDTEGGYRLSELNLQGFHSPDEPAPEPVREAPDTQYLSDGIAEMGRPLTIERVSAFRFEITDGSGTVAEVGQMLLTSVLEDAGFDPMVAEMALGRTSIGGGVQVQENGGLIASDDISSFTQDFHEIPADMDHGSLGVDESVTLASVMGLDMGSMHAHAYPIMIAEIEGALNGAGYDDPVAALQENPELLDAARGVTMYAGQDNLGYRDGAPFQPISVLTDALDEMQPETMASVLGLDMGSMHAHAYPIMIAEIEGALNGAGYDDPVAALQENPELLDAARGVTMYAGQDNLGYKDGAPFQPISVLTDALDEMQNPAVLVEAEPNRYASLAAELGPDAVGPDGTFNVAWDAAPVSIELTGMTVNGEALPESAITEGFTAVTVAEGTARCGCSAPAQDVAPDPTNVLGMENDGTQMAMNTQFTPGGSSFA